MILAAPTAKPPTFTPPSGNIVQLNYDFQFDAGAGTTPFRVRANSHVDGPVIFAGKSFTGAVAVANVRARESAVAQAQAVLQAADGAYWVGALSSYSHGTEMIDGMRGASKISHAHVVRFDGSLKAVVGVETLANFTRRTVDLDLKRASVESRMRG